MLIEAVQEAWDRRGEDRIIADKEFLCSLTVTSMPDRLQGCRLLLMQVVANFKLGLSLFQRTGMVLESPAVIIAATSLVVVVVRVVVVMVVEVVAVVVVVVIVITANLIVFVCAVSCTFTCCSDFHFHLLDSFYKLNQPVVS